MSNKKIGLFADISKEEAMRLSNKVGDWLENRNHLVSINPIMPSVLKGLDFAITFGGDGTVLRTANALAPYNIPMARVNFGTKGYLCNIEPQRIIWTLKKILADQFRIETQTRIKAQIFKEEELVCSFDAFNEIVIGSTPKKKTAWLQVLITDRDMGYKKILATSGDGLIIATRGGSTGYCLSADGPALLIDAFVVVASNGRYDGFLPSYARSFVISCNAQLEITVLRGGSNLPCVGADSDDERIKQLEEGERVIIVRSEFKNLFIEF